MNKGSLSIFLSSLMFLASVGAFGQQPAPSPSPDEFNSDTSNDDVLILVNVTAKELKFEAVPNTKVEFPAQRHLKNIWVTQRQNLPERLEPGIVYRNIGIQLRISSRLADIERIVREALGEVPITGEPTTSVPKPVSPEPRPAEVAHVAAKPTTPRPVRRPRRR
jgi:hypothetical protein